MKALSIQVQPERSLGLNAAQVRLAFEAIAKSPLVIRHQFDEGFDKGSYINFTFEMENLRELWQLIRSEVYEHPDLSSHMAKASIAVCDRSDGWNDYLLLYSFNTSEPLDRIE